MINQIFSQLITVFESRKYKNIYIKKEIRNNWITDWNNYSFRYTPFGKNPNKHKAYISVNNKLVSSKDLYSIIKDIRKNINNQ